MLRAIVELVLNLRCPQRDHLRIIATIIHNKFVLHFGAVHHFAENVIFVGGCGLPCGSFPGHLARGLVFLRLWSWSHHYLRDVEQIDIIIFIVDDVIIVRGCPMMLRRLPS